MRCDRFTKATRLIAGLIIGLLFAITVVPLGAQPARESRPGQGFGPVYNAAREISVSGMVQEVVTKHTPGSPAGMHLIVSGVSGLVDAHVGYFLTKNTRAALHVGLPVQIVGAMVTMHGRQILLARQLSFGGRTVTVRNRNGFMAHPVNPRTRTLRSASSTTNGGAR
jgi:hypothetical protein